MPTQRADEISYYEELGVEPDSSPKEIRDSFRALVRLLHPDHHTDPALKSIAERQLRRVNRVYAVLSDPEKRRRYDLASDEEFTPATIVFNPSSNIDPRRFVARFLWIGASVIFCGTCAWLLIDSFEPSPVQFPDHPANLVRAAAPVIPRDASASLDSELENLRSDLRRMRAERDAARSEATRLKEMLDTGNDHPLAVNGTAIAPAPALPAMDQIPAFKTPLLPSRTQSGLSAMPAPRGSSRQPGSDAHQFAGFWFFAPTSERTNKNLYPPQFIEAILTEHNGVVHGKYRSRYQIVDRAISPDVNFEFTGSTAGATLTTPWVGFGGAKGQVVLSLIGENSLKFDWKAVDLGSAQGLSSGTATLTRRVE